MTFFSAASGQTTAKRNPYEVGLGIGGGAAAVVGVVLAAVGRGVYASDERVAGYANSMGGGFFQADSSALQLASFGAQLAMLGIVVLVGMAFYWMTRWNKAHEA